MIDIYDEVGYIKTVLQDGLSEKWQRDATLLIRYYKSLGEKKSEVKKKIKEKCERNKKFEFNSYVHFRRLNAVIDSAWKTNVPLRQICKIEITREVLEWFLGLENSFILTDEEVAKLKKRRPKVVIKNKVMNWQRVKYLFTLYIWTKVQENYLEKPNMHYLKQYNKRFKEDADLKTSFNMQRERDLLYDLGFIGINYALGIDASFIEKYEVFKTPITDDNRIVITGDDMYHCGYWLEKQKMGSFVCKNCGKEFAHYSRTKQEMGRKYCKECADVLSRRVKKEEEMPAPEGYRYCEECGELFELKSEKDYSSTRCPECQNIKRKEQERINSLKYWRKLHQSCDS